MLLRVYSKKCYQFSRRSIWPIDGILTGTTTPDLCGQGVMANKMLLNVLVFDLLILSN